MLPLIHNSNLLHFKYITSQIYYFLKIWAQQTKMYAIMTNYNEIHLHKVNTNGKTASFSQLSY